MEILETTELVDFDRLYRENFQDQFPLPSNRNTTTVRTVYRNNKPIASGLVKALAEAIIVTDQKVSPLARMKAIDLMVDNMLKWCHMYNVEQIHAFVKEDFARYLIERYRFERTHDVSIVLNTGA